jgi:hypothetical protein
MIVEMACRRLSAGTDRAAAMALYRPSAGQWPANPDPIVA